MTGTDPGPIDSTGGDEDRRPLGFAALRRSDALFDALSDRALSDRGAGSGDGDDGDPALVLLRALVDDVDAGAPPLERAARETKAGHPARRLPRTVVSLCVAAAVLMTTGVAAAGGVLSHFAPSPGRSAPESRSRSDLSATREPWGWAASDSPRPARSPLRRGEAGLPEDELAETSAPSGESPPPKPRGATPSPQPTPTPTPVGAESTGSPTPTPGGQIGPVTEPTGTTSPEGPGQGQQSGTGQEPTTHSAQTSAP